MEKEKLKQLKIFLEDAHPKMHGDWVGKKSWYEKELCFSLGLNHLPNRYYDAHNDQWNFEIKKGKSIWMDIIRYSEQFIKTDDIKDIITLFLIPNKEKSKIEEIIALETSGIISLLGLTEELAKSCLKLKQEIGGNCNFQKALTLKMVRDRAILIIK